jgi:hypothetical protein
VKDSVLGNRDFLDTLLKEHHHNEVKEVNAGGLDKNLEDAVSDLEAHEKLTGGRRDGAGKNGTEGSEKSKHGEEQEILSGIVQNDYAYGSSEYGQERFKGTSLELVDSKGVTYSIFKNGKGDEKLLTTLSDFESILTLQLTIENPKDDWKVYAEDQGYRVIVYPARESNADYLNVDEDYGMPVLKSETNYGDNLCDIGILDEHDDLAQDYESELTFFAFKTIKPNKKYYLMIKCHSERITAEKNVLDFKMRLSKWEYDYNTTKKEEIAAVEKSFTRNLYNTKNVPRNLNLVIEQNNKSLNKMPDAKITKIDNSDQALVKFDSVLGQRGNQISFLFFLIKKRRNLKIAIGAWISKSRHCGMGSWSTA